jgi:hypothetical protein
MPYKNPNTPPVQTEQPPLRRYHDGHRVEQPVRRAEPRSPIDSLWEPEDDGKA